MELLDRYLQAVQWWLPRREKKDIVAELREDLRSQLEDRETALGRPLTDPEIAEVLKQRGRPMSVAFRFLPQQHLIGPAFYPIYRTVVAAVGLFYFVPWLLVAVGLALFGAGHRGHRALSLLSAWSTAWELALVAFAVITIVFAAVDRFQARSDFLGDWNPRALPRVRDARRIPRFGSIVEIAFGLLAAAWWLDLVGDWTPAAVVGKGGIVWSPGPVWADVHGRFYVPVAALTLALAAVAAADLVRPYRTRLRQALRAAFNLGLAACLAVVLRTHAATVAVQVQRLRGAARSTPRPELVSTITDVAIYWSIAIAALVLLIQTAVEVYRMARLDPAPGRA